MGNSTIGILAALLISGLAACGGNSSEKRKPSQLPVEKSEANTPGPQAGAQVNDGPNSTVPSRNPKSLGQCDTNNRQNCPASSGYSGGNYYGYYNDGAYPGVGNMPCNDRDPCDEGGNPCGYDRPCDGRYPDLGPGLWTCVASDEGFEEHLGGHVMTGRDPIFVQESAFHECNRHHGDCLMRCFEN